MKKVFKPFDVLLPKKNFEKWAVIACDQYTSDKTYWNNVEEHIDSNPSMLKMIVPEAFLDSENLDQKISDANKSMEEYLDSGVFEEHKESMVYVERQQSDGTIRKGIVGVIDLNEYEYGNGSNCLIRPTEDVVLSRIPPRLSVRNNASIESSHALLLVADKEHKIDELIRNSNLEKAYDFNLYPNEENIKGYLLNEELVELIQQELNGMIDNNIMFLVGDGNHSIATAKEYYNSHKENELARYSMVEVINLFDESLIFEPIHRIVFNTHPIELIEELIKFYPGTVEKKTVGHNIEFCCGAGTWDITIPFKYNSLAVGALQKFLDYYIEKEKLKIDYVHDSKEVKMLSMDSGNAGFILPPIEIDSLFSYVKTEGKLPRKTFSIGNQEDKRYYIECRRIK